MADIKKFEKEQAALEMACKMAADTQLVANAASFFASANIVQAITEALTPAVVKEVAMPLMNRRCGFLTDRNGKANTKGQILPTYTEDVVRDAIIDAITIGLLPVGNQFNIIGGRMYPTKEGYTALLAKLGVRYTPFIGAPKAKEQDYIVFPCKMTYYLESEAKKEVKNYTADIILPCHPYDGIDQLRGKAERRLKKQLFEFLSGMDFGDADEDSGSTPYIAQPASVADTDENKAKAAAKFAPQAAPAQVEDAKVVVDSTGASQKPPMTQEEKKALFARTIAEARAKKAADAAAAAEATQGTMNI